MKKKIEISVFEVIGSPLCVASDDGQKIYNRLSAAFNQSRHVSLSFRNISALTSAFLNTAVGQLYGEFDENLIHELMEVENIDPDDKELLERVKITAKQYFEDKDGFRKAILDN